jgi:hypothetical protein
VVELLKFKMRYSRPHVKVLWTGSDASCDTWEPLENLTNCEEAERATGRTLSRPAQRPPLATGPAPPLLPPTGFIVDTAPPSDLSAALVDLQLLYWWPDEVAGRWLAALHRRPPLPTCVTFSHVVAYTRQTSALRCTADSLLDSASYCALWVLLSPAAAAGVRGRPLPHP